MLYDPASGGRAVRRQNLPGTVACAMSPLAGGVLVPLEFGQVFYLNPADGEPLAAPFQPRLEPQRKVRYQPAAQTDESGRQFVITDGQEKIYLVERVDQPQPHFNLVTEAKVGAFPIVAPLAVLGDHAFAVVDGGAIARFALPSLQVDGQTALPGDVVWGPYRVGELLLVATAKEQLVAVKQDGSIAWSDALIKGGELAGPPLATDDGVLFAYRQGTLERRGLADGQAAGRLNVEQPLESGPAPFMNRFALATHDGTLLIVDRP